MGQLDKLRIFPLLIIIVYSIIAENGIVTAQSPLQVDIPDNFHLLQNHKSLNNGFTTKEKVEEKVEKVADSSKFDDRSLAWRLPREVLPVEYIVRISPVLEAGQDAVGKQWTTPGEVSIRVISQNATNRITLHAHAEDLVVHDVKLNLGSMSIPVTKFEILEYDFLTIDLDEKLEEGQIYRLNIIFTSNITEKLNGLYRSRYIDTEGNEKWIATTQMEATNARQVIPCFDEPGIKSFFQFTIGRMDKHFTLHNTDRVKQSYVTEGPAPGWVYESFDKTPKMSTYLLALIISEFDYTEAPNDLFPGKRIRTYAPSQYIQEDGGVYAAENAAKVLSFFSSHFGYEYPMNKMDSAAVPDFYFGAMENYGLNIYRENALLYFPDRSLESERWSITSVIAHELAHQWFGNLVSPAWWTYVWLNEGFATYFSQIACAQTNPEFESTKRFINDAFQRSMEYAADPSYAHSVKIVEADWGTKDPMSWFDRMAYDQGSSLIRMMDGFLSTRLFILGIRNYISQLADNIAQQDNLFQQLNNVAASFDVLPEGLTMKDIMDTWTLKPGFPIVRVSKASASRIYVSQEKFTNNFGVKNARVVNGDNELWHIPISVATKSSPNFEPSAEYWLHKEIAMTSWEINAEEWIILNAGATGYFRVLYDDQLTNLINVQLNSNHTVISDVTRSQMLDDYFSAAYQKYVNLERALDLTKYLSKETEIIVWNTVLKHLRKPLNLLAGGSNGEYQSFRNYILPRIKSAFNLVGGINKEFLEKAGMAVIRHQQFVDWACALEDDECQTFAVNKVDEWKRTRNNAIPRDIQANVYCSGVAKGNDDIFRFIKEQYDNTSTTEIQRSRLLNGLACTTDSGATRELLDGCITSGYFKTVSDASTILGRIAATPLGRASVFQFIRENTQAIIDYFGNAAPIRGVYATAASYISSTTELDDLKVITEEILELITDDGIKRDISNSLLTVQGNIEWMQEFSQSFLDL